MSNGVMDYGQNFQELIVNVMATTPDLFVRCQNIVDPSYFDPKFAKAVEYIRDYSYKNNTLPCTADVKVKTGYLPERVDEFNDAHHEVILLEIEEFCRHKALESAVIQSMEYVKDKKYGEIEKLVKEAMMVSLQKNIGTNYFADPETRNRELFSAQASIKTHWSEVDYKLFGGFGRGELEIFVAPSGGGKSLVLQNLSLNFSKSGLPGVYISLELREALIAQRMDSMLTGRSKKVIMRDIKSASEDVILRGKNMANMYIKRLPESTTTVHDIRAYLRELQIKTGIKIAYLAVDYLDLLATPQADSKDVFMKDKFISEELRSLAEELDIVVISASQLNRCLALDTLVQIKDRGVIEIKDVNIGDFILSTNDVYNTITSKTDPLAQDVYKIELASGKSIVCSAKHVFPTFAGENALESGLHIGSKLLIRQNVFKYCYRKLNSVIRNIIR